MDFTFFIRRRHNRCPDCTTVVPSSLSSAHYPLCFRVFPFHFSSLGLMKNSFRWQSHTSEMDVVDNNNRRTKRAHTHIAPLRRTYFRHCYFVVGSVGPTVVPYIFAEIQYEGAKWKEERKYCVISDCRKRDWSKIDWISLSIGVFRPIRLLNSYAFLQVIKETDSSTFAPFDLTPARSKHSKMSISFQLNSSMIYFYVEFSASAATWLPATLFMSLFMSNCWFERSRIYIKQKLNRDECRHTVRWKCEQEFELFAHQLTIDTWRRSSTIFQMKFHSNSLLLLE